MMSLLNLQIFIFLLKKNDEEFELCVNIHLFPCMFIRGAGTETRLGEFGLLSLDVPT